jgi:prophage antirepressor-like protein
MMSDLIPFNFDSHAIRVHIATDGQPWWVLRDVCDALGIGNTGEVANRLNPLYLESINFQDVSRPIRETDVVLNEPEPMHGNRGNNISLLIVNEPGLYEVIFRSNKPEAKAFRQWVFEEVLPSIRKTGKYEIAAPPRELPSPRDTVLLAELSVDLLERLGQLTARDKLGYADMIRNATLSPSNPLLASPQSYGFSAAERVAQLGYRIPRRQQASLFPGLGKRLAEEYRSRYGDEPEKVPRFVDGATRKVGWYLSEDAAWVDPIIQSYLSGFGFVTA